MAGERVTLNVAQAAAKVGVSEQTVRNWIDNGGLPAERVAAAGRGRPGWLILESDLLAYNRRRFASPGNVAASPALLLTDEDKRADALSLELVWPDEGRSRPFSLDIFDGYSDVFRAVTYTPSFEAILWLLTEKPLEQVEVIFGDERLVRGDKANPLVVQQAIDDLLTFQFLGVGGSKDPVSAKLLEYQAAGRLRLMAMAPGVVHSKLYLMEGPAGRRVMAGSANLSRQALSGRQGEVLYVHDNHPYVWQLIERKYEAIRDLAEKAPLKLKSEIKPAEMVKVADLPVGATLKSGAPVDIYIPGTTAEPGPGDSPQWLGVRTDDLDKVLGNSLATNLKPGKDGKVSVTLAKVHQIDRAVAAEVRNPAVTRPPRLDIADNGRFIYDGRPVLPPEDPEAVAQDAWVITQYFNLMERFGEGAATMQRNYFGFMGWFFFAPFMSSARRERQKESPKNANFKLMALLYGPANSGKSGLVDFLQSAMFGDRTTYTDKGVVRFNPSDCAKLLAQRGALPIFFDDVAASRFTATRGREITGEQIAKEYDQASNQGLPYYPCLLVAMNADAREFSDPVRKRCLMVYANKSIPEDDSDLRAEMDAAVLPLHNRIGRAFYAEYLDRMSRRISLIKEGEWMDFDYLLESTSLIRTMLDENRGPDEELPHWCKPVGWQVFDDLAWELKRNQLKNLLDSETQVKPFPPSVGRWMQRGDTIYLGVEDYRAELKSNEYPSYLLNQAACHAGVIALDKNQTIAMLRRSDDTYELPEMLPDEPAPQTIAEPPPPTAEEAAEPKRGMLPRILRAIRG